jgi:hypothetical protein
VEAAIDTVVISHLLRPPRTTQGRQRSGTALDEYLRRGDLRIGLDRQGGVIDEWKQTCGGEYVQILVTAWNDFGALVIVDRLGTIPRPVSKKLRQRGFNDAIDKLLLKVALAIKDHVVASEDSDFWDPQFPPRDCIGDHNAYVAHLLHEQCEVQVLTLSQLLAKLK